MRQEESVALREEVLEKLPTVDEVQARLGTSGAPGGVPLAQQIGLRVKRVVIDPGHGGKDTGAVGKKGTREKDVALQIAKQVRAKLRERLPDIEVLMTRETDAFVALEERTRIANDASADLFISIHANANPSRKVSGVETYYLNITHDRYAIRLAARENTHSGDDKRISDLQFILADLAMKSNVDESIRLGTEVQKSLIGRLRQNYGAVHDHGLKHALFYVLMGARMPAILVETSFISNRTEEERLRSTKYREAVADGIVLGVERFVEARHAFYAGE
ncbi:MAG: N-acetylmuramoyl-L-alanine amidase family protein [Myxococcota bacterium]